MTGRRPATLLALALLVALVDGRVASEPVAAQTDPTLDLVDQTWIVDDDPVVIVVAIDRPIDDARLEIRVDTPVTSREAVRAVHDGTAPGGRVARFGGPLDSFTDDTTGDGNTTGPEPATTKFTIEIPDDEVGEFLRGSPGALPIIVDLTVDGSIVDTLVTHVVVPHDGDDALDPVRLGVTDTLVTGPSHRPDQTVTVPTAELDAELDRLETLPDLPVALGLRPETLSALQATGDRDRLTRLAELVADHELLLEPWVPLDEEGWRLVGGTDRVLDLYSRGRDTVVGLLDTAAEPLVALDADATESTVGLLRSAGATAALVTPDQIEGDRASLDGLDTTRPVEVVDDNGTPLPALVLDDDLADTLRHDDPELAAHRAATELAALVAEQDGERAVVVDLDGIDPATLDLLTDLLDEHDQTTIEPVSVVLDSEPAPTVGGGPVRARFVPAPPTDLSDDAALLRDSERDLAAYTAIVAEEALIAPLRTGIDAAADDNLTTDDRRDHTIAVADGIANGTDDIGLVDTGRVTLATRTADLPLTIHNGQPVPATVRLHLTAEKLVFPDGDTVTIELQPGENPVDIRVESRASGDARINATLSSPDDHLLLDDAVIPIRSTALSGLGLLISGVALTVLVVWWIRTVLRTRRSRGAASVDPTNPDADPTTGGPGPGAREEP